MSLKVHEVHMGEMKNAEIMLIWKPDRKKPCMRPRCRWEDNI
jgi:hypothetical protein